MNFKKPYPVLLLVMMLSCSILFCTAFANPFTDHLPFNESKTILDTIPGSDTSNIDGVFEKVEEEAYFPGGETQWRHYLEQNLNASTPVEYGAPAGSYTVWVQFVVDTAGRLSAFKALTRHNFGMEAEVLRILRKSPPWVPAVQKGHKVKAYRKQPVTFVVIEEKKKRRNRD